MPRESRVRSRRGCARDPGRHRPLGLRRGPPSRLGRRLGRRRRGRLDDRRRHLADLPAVLQQADAGRGHAPSRPRPRRRAACPVRRQPLRRGVPLEGVRRILAGAGLDESFLQTPPDYPLDDEARVGVTSGPDTSRPSIAMNCSGKHAGMLATCVVNDWPIDTYLSPDHPLQAGLAETFAELTDGADRVDRRRRLRRPAVLDLAGRAGPRVPGARRSRRRAAAERRVADAFVAHPTYASGTQTRRGGAARRRSRARSARRARRRCYAVALPDGRARRAQDRRRGVPRPAAGDGCRLATARRRPGGRAWTATPSSATGVAVLLGGGRPVGELRVVHPDLSP